jgi:hypothetical protein
MSLPGWSKFVVTRLDDFVPARQNSSFRSSELLESVISQADTLLGRRPIAAMTAIPRDHGDLVHAQ